MGSFAFVDDIVGSSPAYGRSFPHMLQIKDTFRLEQCEIREAPLVIIDRDEKQRKKSPIGIWNYGAKYKPKTRIESLEKLGNDAKIIIFKNV